MKLFAITATAVSGRFTGRVDTPAPGFVNEQGGYWADQTSDQSRHYPQPPQRQWPQEEQRQQKPQCCNGYFWTSPTGERVWMSQSGENDMKPMYKGLDKNGNDHVLYWAFDEVSDNRPFIAIPGHWYFGDEIGDENATKSDESYTIRHCPTDHVYNWGSTLKLECGQNPDQQYQEQTRECCDAFNLWTDDGNVQMVRVGEHDQRPVYKGEDKNGDLKWLIWFFDEVSDNRPVQAVPGKWILTPAGPNHPEAIISDTLDTMGYQSCPNEVNWANRPNLQCTQAPQPPPPETCDDVLAQKHQKTFITTGAPAPPFTDITHCQVPRMMDTLVRNQLNILMNMFGPESKPSTMDSVFFNLAEAWRAMTRKGNDGQDNCGFSNDFRFGETGFVSNCDSMCSDIKKIEKPQDFAAILDEFLALVDSNFDKSTYFNFLPISKMTLQVNII